MDAKELKLYRNLRHRILDRGQFRLQKTAEYKEADERFRSFCRTIADPVEREVVRLYYAEVRSCVWIAEELSYSESQIKRIKKRAIGLADE